MSFAEHHYNQPNWWKDRIVYQVWPMSYKDSNGDGIGDIPGLISTLDYLKELGVNVVWLSPMYDSPQVDYGYDISDYQNVYAPFGTVADMDLLIKECHSRDIKLLLDLVINHTSDQHKWFQESKSSKTNEKADWYYWKDPKIVDGKRHPPNNWRATFGGSAWDYVPERDQYYLHLFAPEQPDLNWENDTARKAVFKEAIEFWLDKGIDGFRVDTVVIYSKNVEFPDTEVVNPGDEFQPAFHHYEHGPRIHEFLKEIRRDVLNKYGDIAMVGEYAGPQLDTVLKYISAEREELSCVLDCDLMGLGGRQDGTLKKHHTYKHVLSEFKGALEKVQNIIQTTDAWGTVFLENHDQARSLNRFATDSPQYREKAAKMLAVLCCTLSGTLFIYQGQEIGMYNFPETWGVEDMKDIDSLFYLDEIKRLHNDDPMWTKKAMKGLQKICRDNARLPVQWDKTSNAGFTTGTPWMRVHDAYATTNVATQLLSPSSPLNFWKKMISLRKQYADLTIFGGFVLHDRADNEVFTYIKIGKDGREILVLLNFSDEVQPWDIPGRLKGRELEVLVSNVGDGEEVGKYLSPWEGRILITKS